MRSLVWIATVSFAFLLSGCDTGEPSMDTTLQLAADVETIDGFLASNNIDAIKDKSGIRFHIVELGTGGLPPRLDQQIKVNYIGKFMSGTAFDQGGDATGVLNTFITGWQLALSTWPVGTKATLYIPSPLAYGNQQVGTIPPNTILTFDIFLKEVNPTNAEKARLAADIATIDSYLEGRSIDAVKDSTGVRYVITREGTGPLPTWYTKLRFNYTGKLLSSGNEFYTGTSQPTEQFDSRMCDFLHGLKIGLSKIGVGGKITVYVPSGLAFGPAESTQSSLPANSIVYYDIELVEMF
jgi:FKBP-type peptidyl-prolyl cis-trans isomerase